VSAYRALIDTYKDLAFTLANNIVVNREDAEEIVQDAFVKAFVSLKSFKGNARFSTWFYRIVVNTSLNKKKQKKFDKVVVDPHIEEEIADAGVFPVNRFTNKEQTRFIKAALVTLVEAERVCLTMYYLNELSVEEISGLTGFSTSNIKVLLHRGRKHMYDQLRLILKDELHHLI
jgi:RNA polymerase sigma-70 factor (ECF subfamily)